MMQPHIRCQKGDISKICLLPGDPQRVNKIAKHLKHVKEVANNREFFTVRGNYDGVDITVTSTGIGCPSAAIAVEELANIGAEVFLRIGTCGALKEGIQPGDLIIPYAAIRAEGTTKEYIEPEFPAVADLDVTRFLEEGAKKLRYRYFRGIDRCHDAFYEHLDNMLRWGKLYQDKRMGNWNVPLVSSEMECSAVFLIPLLRGLKAGAVLAVNTTEPLTQIVKNPNLAYQLIESPSAHRGVERAIEVALYAAKKISAE